MQLSTSFMMKLKIHGINALVLGLSVRFLKKIHPPNYVEGNTKLYTPSQLCRGKYKTVASLNLSGRAPCKGGPFFSALGAIHSHKVQHSLVTWGRLKTFFSITALIPSVKMLN